MQSADHGQRQRALAVQDFVDAVAFADDRLKIFDGQTALIHPEFDPMRGKPCRLGQGQERGRHSRPGGLDWF